MQHTTARILFVDDHEDTRLMVKMLLALSNYEVATAESMASGLHMAQSESFDLYILDTRLSDGSGRELCAKIREFDERTPIIFFSGETPQRLQLALKCGAQACVMKPELDGLRQAIRRAINMARA
jgi:DNA-binding response OmpR family regulator